MRSEELERKVAKNVTAFRKNLGLSQRQFALKAGIEPSHLNKIERFVMSLSFNNLQKISDTYKISPKSFFEFSKKETKEPLQKKAILILLDGVKETWKLKLIADLIWGLHSSTKEKD